MPISKKIKMKSGGMKIRPPSRVKLMPMPNPMLMGSGRASFRNTDPPPFYGGKLYNEEDEKYDNHRTILRGGSHNKKGKGMVLRLQPGIGGIPSPQTGEVFDPKGRAHQQSMYYRPDSRMEHIRPGQVPAVAPPLPPFGAPVPDVRLVVLPGSRKQDTMPTIALPPGYRWVKTKKGRWHVRPIAP